MNKPERVLGGFEKSCRIPRSLRQRYAFVAAERIKRIPSATVHEEAIGNGAAVVTIQRDEPFYFALFKDADSEDVVLGAGIAGSFRDLVEKARADGQLHQFLARYCKQKRRERAAAEQSQRYISHTIPMSPLNPGCYLQLDDDYNRGFAGIMHQRQEFFQAMNRRDTLSKKLTEEADREHQEQERLWASEEGENRTGGDER